jgi:CopG family transcriptional regulator/antitoxin EndoAI
MIRAVHAWWWRIFDIHITGVYASGIGNKKPMSKRINIVLPDETVAVLDRVAAKGSRSRFISRAVMHLVETEGKANLRERLKAEALANAERDLAIAVEWFPLEEESARMFERRPNREKPGSRNGHDVSETGLDLSRLLRSHHRPRDQEDAAGRRHPERRFQ